MDRIISQSVPQSDLRRQRECCLGYAFIPNQYYCTELTSILAGLVTAGICNLCMAASLAEFLSAYPTAGGQYHWVAVTSWRSWMPILSWITGWVNCSGWVALVATGGLLGSQLILGVISLMNPVCYFDIWLRTLH